MVDYACKKCNRIVTKKECPFCEDALTSKNWKGMSIVLNSTKSVIAKKLNIESNGVYALRVR